VDDEVDALPLDVPAREVATLTVPLISATQIDRSSELMLAWLRARTDDWSKPLVDDLLERRLMKRILVCSRLRREGSAIDWDKVGRLFAKQQWRRILAASDKLQADLAEVVEDSTPNFVTGSAATVDDKDAFVRECALRSTVLLDYPIFKSGSAEDLQYLREEEWSEQVVDSFRADAVEKSSVWAALADQAYVALAKLRVYCDPQFAPLLRAVVDREQFESLVNDAVLEGLRVPMAE
jgi:hypothetical protein